MAFNFFGILKGLLIENEVDRTKQVLIQSSSASTTNTTTTITSAQTANRTLTLPDVTDTLTANAATQTLQNKTLTGALVGSSTTNNLSNSLQLSELASTPSSNPAANYLSLYSKADGFLYTLNPSGTELSVSQQQVPNNRIISNISGVTAFPLPNTLTGIIDSAISSTQGSILYRNASAWVSLSPGTSGQALVTAGAAANPAWQGVGSVTSVGTGTGLTGGPITTTGTISLDNIASNTLLSNVTGGSAAPTANSISSVIDNAISNTQGAILYRNAAGWVALPPGTSGQLLRTAGAGANPTWANGSTVSGDPNTVAFFNGSGTLTDQTTFSWDGSNLGIGVNATDSKARIHADSSTTSGTVGTGAFIFGKVHTTKNIGNGSVIFSSQSSGTNSAESVDSFVAGANNALNSDYSFVIGSDNTVSGGSGVGRNFVSGISNTLSAAVNTGYSSIFGSSNVSTTNGKGSFIAGGFGNTVDAENAFAAGTSTYAQGYAQMVLGRWNVLQGTPASWQTTDDVFIIGNGTGSGARSNAFKVVKDGTAVVNRLSLPSGALQNLPASGQINTTGNTFIRVTGIASLGSPSLNNGTYDGQIVTIYNQNTSGVISLQHTATVRLPGGTTLSLGPNDSVTLIWDNTNTKWITMCSSNNA